MSKSNPPTPITVSELKPSVDELIESVKASLEDVFYDTLNCGFDADILARAAIEALGASIEDEVRARIALPPEALRVLDEMTDEVAFSAATIASNTGIPEQRVREWHRAFKVLGLAEFGVLRDLDDDGGLRGRGYWLNDKGYKLRAALSNHRDTEHG